MGENDTSEQYFVWNWIEQKKETLETCTTQLQSRSISLIMNLSLCNSSNLNTSRKPLMALPHSISALATTLTLSSPTTKPQKVNPFPFFSNQKTRFLTKQTRPRSRRSLSLTPARVAAPPSTVEADQSYPETENNETEEEFNDESSYSKFTWRDHWYPVSLIEDLNPLLPTPFQFLMF